MLGVSVFGFMTALGVGTTMAVLANKMPNIFIGYSDILFSFLNILTAFIIYSLTKKRYKQNSMTVKLSDTIGLAALTVLSSGVAIERNFNLISILLLGVLAGVGSGLISDLLTLKYHGLE